MTTKRFKAVVIGTGAGGAPAAMILAQHWGEGVGILEAGKQVSPPAMNQIERDMVPAFYVQGGVQATEDGTLSVLQGQAVGGSTIINDALCFRPPPELAERWQAYGISFSLEELEPFVKQAEELMEVSQIPKSMINRANYLVGLGAARLGWPGERLHHNAVGCVECGFRHIGCAYTAKKSTELSFVPAALQAGAKLFPNTSVHHLERTAQGWRIDCGETTFEAEHVVLAAGVVQTPTILLRSGIQAGDNLQFHVQTVAYGDFDERVDGFNGIPMSYGVLQFADVYGHRGPGYLIEGVSVQPMAFSVHLPFEGLEHQETLERYRHLAGALSLVRSTSRGSVTLKGDRPSIEYPVNRHDLERLADFYQQITKLFMAAGASRTLLTHRELRWVTEPTPVPHMNLGSFYVYTAHPFGGANRGQTTDDVGRVKDQKNLWVLDASAFPEAPGVNPQITIAAMALQGASRIVSS